MKWRNCRKLYRAKDKLTDANVVFFFYIPVSLPPFPHPGWPWQTARMRIGKELLKAVRAHVQRCLFRLARASDLLGGLHHLDASKPRSILPIHRCSDSSLLPSTPPSLSSPSTHSLVLAGSREFQPALRRKRLACRFTRGRMRQLKSLLPLHQPFEP